ncbi:MAG: hypothetical protein DI570_31760, partial [Phenylobacterium zucineum]
MAPTRIVTGSSAAWPASCASTGATPVSTGASAIVPATPSAVEVRPIAVLDRARAMSSLNRANALSARLTGCDRSPLDALARKADRSPHVRQSARRMAPPVDPVDGLALPLSPVRQGAS